MCAIRTKYIILRPDNLCYNNLTWAKKTEDISKAVLVHITFENSSDVSTVNKCSSIVLFYLADIFGMTSKLHQAMTRLIVVCGILRRRSFRNLGYLQQFYD